MKYDVLRVNRIKKITEFAQQQDPYPEKSGASWYSRWLNAEHPPGMTSGNDKHTLCKSSHAFGRFLVQNVWCKRFLQLRHLDNVDILPRMNTDLLAIFGVERA